MKDRAELLAAISTLPQFSSLPEARVSRWVESLLAKDLDKSPDFYVRRLFGVGQSELAPLIAHYHPDATNRNLKKGNFKSAVEISREKLLLASPFTTTFAKRGNLLEPFIRDLFMYMHADFSRDQQGINAGMQHATCRFSIGNPDDVFRTASSKRLLVDYKSTIVFDSDEERFSNICQLNGYAENMRSNGLPPDLACTAKLRSDSEYVFEDIIAAYNERENDPLEYEFWLQRIAQKKLKSVTFEINPVTITPEFGSLGIAVIEKFMTESIICGKPLGIALSQTVLLDDEKLEAERIEGKLFQFNAAKNAVKYLHDRALKEAEEFQTKIGKPFMWPGKFPVTIKATPEIDQDAAIAALEANGVDTSSIYVQSESKEVDKELLMMEFTKIGGVVDAKVYKQSVSKEKLETLLNSSGLSSEMFATDLSTSAVISRKAQDDDYKDSETSTWAQSIYKNAVFNIESDLENSGSPDIETPNISMEN